MVDIAEDAWLRVLDQPTSILSTPSKDVFVAHYQAQTLIRTEPLHFSKWIQSTLHLANQMIERPWDGLLILKNALQQWSLPIGLALSLVLLLHLWLWCRVLIAEAPRWMLLSSKLTVFIALLTLSIATWISGNSLWGLHILLCLSIPYSRKPVFALVGAGVTSVFLAFAPFSDVFVQTQQVGAINEALNLGRTRIEFSPTALADLTPIQKVIWSERNQDVQAAKYWLEKSPRGFEREALELELRSTDLSVTELTKAYENLLEKYPHETLVRFNLAQLYTRGQELVKADRMRATIDRELFQTMSEWSSRTGRLLLGPQNDPMKSPLFDFFKNRFIQKAGELGLYPFSWPRGIFYLIGFLLPWFLFLGAILYRPRALGLCSATGATSPSPTHTTSALYQSALQRREPSSQPFRAEIEKAARSNALSKSRQSSFWNIFVVGSYELVYEDALLRPFLKSFVLYALIWFSLPLSMRFGLAHQFKIRLEPTFSSGGLFFIPIIAAIFLWAYYQWERYRKAQR